MLILKGTAENCTSELNKEVSITDKNCRKTSIAIRFMEMDFLLASAILKFFKDCSKKGLKMEKLELMLCQFNSYLVSVLYAALSMDLFEKISMCGEDIRCGEDISSEPDLNLLIPELRLRHIKPRTSKRLRAIRVFDVDMTPAHIMVLSDISIMTSKLETLSLRYCEGLSEVAVQAILGTTHTLKTFRVEYCSLKDNELFRVVERVVEYNPSLEELDVRGNYCGDLSLQTIANCMGRPESTLTVLHISDPLDGHEHDSDDDSRETWYNARDFSVLANAIKISNRIRQLTIRCKVPATQYEGLVNTLLRCPTIEKLHLSNNESSTLNFESIDLESLVHDVKTSCSLKELCLSKTPLSEAEPLFRVLSQCPKLEVLRLHRVGLKRLDFSTSFAKPSPCPLRCLSLRGNSFEHDLRLDNNEHENVIIDVLQANPMLSSLHFNNTGKRRDTIENYQHMNWAGRMLLGNDKVPQSLWPMVIKRVNKHRHWKMADKANAIYGLLRDSDTLMCDH